MKNIFASTSLRINLLLCVLTIDFWLFERRGVLPVLLGTVGAGIGISSNFNQQYLPQLMWFTTATPPDINIKVSSAEGAIWDITGAGVNEFATIRQLSRTANYYLLELANSLIPWKTVTYTFVNQTAAAFNVYGDSLQQLPDSQKLFNIAVSQQILAASGAQLDDFSYIACPSAGATDRFTITYKDRTSQTYDSRDELKAILQFTQNSITTTGYNIDNNAQNIKQVQFFPAATQSIFVRKYSRIGNVQSTLIARQ